MKIFFMIILLLKKELETKDIAQWKDTYYKAEKNVKKSIAEDLYKLYLVNHQKTIRKLFQILDFTGINDKRILSDSIVSKAFMQSCERFIEI